MILVEIPLIAGAPDQTLDTTLDGQPFTLRVLWNVRFEYWSLSISERDGALLLSNIKMVNNYPLIKRFQRVDVAGEIYFVHRGGLVRRPTFEDVGGDFGLFYYDPEDLSVYPVPSVPRG